MTASFRRNAREFAEYLSSVVTQLTRQSLACQFIKGGREAYLHFPDDYAALGNGCTLRIRQRLEGEGVNPRSFSPGMRKSIMDVAWSQFISMTVSKAEEAGRQVILVDARNTSKMCSGCGAIVPKTLSERTHTCPSCGLIMGRDHNAALNILHRGIQTLRQ